MADNNPEAAHLTAGSGSPNAGFALNSKSTATCRPSSDTMNIVEASPSAYTASKQVNPGRYGARGMVLRRHRGD